MESKNIPKATAVLAPPVADWQEGVVVVTGHSDGHLLLWKLQRSLRVDARSVASSSTSSGLDRPMDDSKRHSRSDAMAGDGKSKTSMREELIVVCSPMRVHRAEISVIRMCSSQQATKTKPLVSRCFEGGNTLELLVGDVQGWVSRWVPVRLEQLPMNEIQQVFSLPITSSVNPISSPVTTGPLARAENFMTESLFRLGSNTATP
eukprot:CAMPEP_0182426334 /NCGR_PEP_ID=MMETSP1167-20130531/12816_1 /TAXON_ID=2988 /ORGANISM="Mallomonas Sp, Strain CCMP3275" /LENGTH=204 /DNA_ID=CAMNT_0024607679 /DNA_START=144 /DNA_END=758 /DNA_ORIENTATION=-